MGDRCLSYFPGRSFRFLVSFAFLLGLYLSLPLISAQENGDKDPSNTDLGRRGKIFADKIRNSVTNQDQDWADSDSGLGLLDGFFASLSMILVSEIGDETFIIAALMAMRHPKSIVLSGALSALFVMTILSTGLGRIVPNLISRKHTNSAATVLYAFFGLRLIYIAWKSDSKASQKKEIEEVEEKLEAGQGKTTWRRFFSRFCTPIYLESFILTFLAEWGDRSQIATIALATHKKCCWSCCRSYHRTHHLYFSGNYRWKYAGIEDFAAFGCNSRRAAFHGLFFVIILLSSSMIAKSLVD